MIAAPGTEEITPHSTPRRSFRHQLQQTINAAERENSSVALLLMDLDRFREVNHTLGHHVGDLLLQQIAPRIQRVLHQSDLLAPLGGDEFAVLMQVKNTDRASLVAREILKILEEPFYLEGLRLDVQASIGVAFFPEHGPNADIVLQRADVALYAAKANKNGYVLYKPEQDESNAYRLSLMGELRRAIVENQLFLLYQPKIDLHSGHVTGVEALVRWRHPRLGVLLPDQFVPLAEKTGLIMPLTLWVLHEALRQSRKWHQAGLHVNVAANISMLNLQSRALPDQIAGLLRAWEVPASSFGLEITESTIMADPARTMEIVKQMSDMGLQFSIDDFGTGYSSLAYLSKLPIDEIKIDKSFVLNMVTQQEDTVIVRSTIDLAHNLGLKVVAEGVEDQATRERLAKLGCDAAQGFYLSYPLPPEDLTEILSNPPQRFLDKWLRRNTAPGKQRDSLFRFSLSD